uniref:Uncharacterized protein n=1 Tax=Arundo donax TaxID=35708 RepID=A0A0A9E992_ARUDO
MGGRRMDGRRSDG